MDKVSNNRCIYCEYCYAKSLLNSNLADEINNKQICLSCLEHIMENALFPIQNKEDDMKVIFSKDKKICGLCDQHHTLFVKTMICEDHNGQFKYLHDVQYLSMLEDYSYYDRPERDYYSYEYLDEITHYLSNIIKSYDHLNYQIFEPKYMPCHTSALTKYIVFYNNTSPIATLILHHYILILSINSGIYSDRYIDCDFKDNIFGNKDVTILTSNDIMGILKNNLGIKCDQPFNNPRDDVSYYYSNAHYILMDRMQNKNTQSDSDQFTSIHDDLSVCNKCHKQINNYFQIFSNGIAIMVIFQSGTDFIVFFEDAKIVYTNSDQCLHYDSLNFEYRIINKTAIEIYTIIIESCPYLGNNKPLPTKKKTWLEVAKSY